MTNPINKLAVLKEIGAIEYRVSDTQISPALRRDCIARHVQNLICDLQPQINKFGAILERLAARHTTEDELVAGCALLRSLVPLTYGSIPAGTVFSAEGKGLYTKRKEGPADIATGAIFKHFAADTIVRVVNH